MYVSKWKLAMMATDRGDVESMQYWLFIGLLSTI